MSLKCVCIASLSKEDFGEILFYRTFPTVLKRCKHLLGPEYVPLPSPHVFVTNLLIKLGLSVSSKEFVEWRDKASGFMQLPVTDVKISDHEIWPVVSIIQNSLVVCCLPLVENSKAQENKDLLQIPSISVGFSVLLGILNFLRMKASEEKVSQLKELDSFLTLSMPFGVPSDIEPSCMDLINTSYPRNYIKKQPAWKPKDFKGKQMIQLKISEYIRCMLTESATSICHYEIFGQIFVKAELEGTQNEVTLSLSSSNATRSLSLDSVLVHPCVQMHGAGASTTVANLLRRLRFNPPLNEFILLQYCSPVPKELPIEGVFKMLGETSVELLIQLKLSDKVKNSFEYFDVIIVFFNRGPVRHFEFNTNHGIPKISDDKHSLKWNIGTKFPKDLEVAVTAKLDFHEKPVLPHNDPFCVDKNCFAQVNFKLANTTLSGCNIDPKSVLVSQSNKPKITIERSIQSREYRLWNNYGQLPFPVNISSKFKNIFL